MIVPRSVITLSETGEIGLRVVGADNLAQFAPVQIIDDTADGLVVTGVPEGVRIITAGQDLVSNGEESSSQAGSGNEACRNCHSQRPADHFGPAVPDACGDDGLCLDPQGSRTDIKIPVIYVSMSYQGISPEDSERLLLRPMETALKSITGIKKMTASAFQGGGNVVIEFQAGADLNKALDDVRNKVAQARPELPDGADEPTVHEVNLSEFRSWSSRCPATCQSGRWPRPGASCATGSRKSRRS